MMSTLARTAKRCLDLAIAGPLAVVLAPVSAVVYVAVRIRMGPPVIFKQVRAGQHGQPVGVWKFRTMTDDRDSNGLLLPDGDRLTRLGLVLRKWSLDELPQLVNILRGEISLVGPRPLLLRYNDRYNERQALRLLAKPGLTGLAQINGRNTTDWATRLEMDVWYVEHWSLWLDLKILARTVSTVLLAQGSTPTAGAELEEFWGETKPPVGPLAFPVDVDERAVPGHGSP